MPVDAAYAESIVERMRAALKKRGVTTFAPTLENKGMVVLQGFTDPDGHGLKLIGTAAKGVYCGRGHPLFEAEEVRIEDVLEYEFAAPTRTLAGATPDGWPSHMPRKVGFFVTDLHIGIQLVREGAYLAVLPDVGCQPLVDEGLMRRLPVDIVPSVPLFASRRKLIGPPGRAEAVLDAVRAVIGANESVTPAPADAGPAGVVPG